MFRSRPFPLAWLAHDAWWHSDNEEAVGWRHCLANDRLLLLTWAGHQESLKMLVLLVSSHLMPLVNADRKATKCRGECTCLDCEQHVEGWQPASPPLYKQLTSSGICRGRQSMDNFSMWLMDSHPLFVHRWRTHWFVRRGSNTNCWNAGSMWLLKWSAKTVDIRQQGSLLPNASESLASSSPASEKTCLCGGCNDTDIF